MTFDGKPGVYVRAEAADALDELQRFTEAEAEDLSRIVRLARHDPDRLLPPALVRERVLSFLRRYEYALATPLEVGKAEADVRAYLDRLRRLGLVQADQAASLQVVVVRGRAELTLFWHAEGDERGERGRFRDRSLNRNRI